MIDNKDKIIEYFKSGIKKTKDFKIGIEHEKFLFKKENSKRVDYSKINEMKIKNKVPSIAVIGTGIDSGKTTVTSFIIKTLSNYFK